MGSGEPTAGANTLRLSSADPDPAGLFLQVKGSVFDFPRPGQTPVSCLGVKGSPVQIRPSRPEVQARRGTGFSLGPLFDLREPIGEPPQSHVFAAGVLATRAFEDAAWRALCGGWRAPPLGALPLPAHPQKPGIGQRVHHRVPLITGTARRCGLVSLCGPLLRRAY